MTLSALQQRLDRLETQATPVPRPPEVSPLSRLLEVMVACHLGHNEGRPAKSIAAGMARGLGYERAIDFSAALTANSEAEAAQDLDQRWRDAMERLFAIKGARVDCDGPTFARTLEALHDDMLEDFRRHPFLLETQP